MRGRSGWRWLGVFWAVVLLAGGAGALTLQALGPPPVPTTTAAAPAEPRGPEPRGPDTRPADPRQAEPRQPEPRGTEPRQPDPPATPATRADAPAAAPPPPTRVAPPDPALLEPGPNGAKLPRIAADGRLPRLAYAAPLPPGLPKAPRVALLVSGFGQSEKDSRAALEALPGPVSFAVSPYAAPAPALMDAARNAGHELLASIPMEPQGYPINDAGSHQLLTGLPPKDNRTNLEWALARTQGAVGATSASDGMRGERFADVSGALDPVLDEIARRGLLYIDARPGRTPERRGLAARSVDVVLDDPPARAEIDAKLVTLERIARERGAAIGLAGPPRPVTVEKLSAWVKTLKDRGIILVPVSALVEAPQ